VVNVCHRYVEDTDWEFSEFALYDLGQAVAHMTLQAQSLGLFARQFRAFDQAGIAAEFDVPVHWQVTSMSAFGRLPPGVATPPAADADQSRRRRSLSEISWLSPPPSAEGDEGAQREPGGQQPQQRGGGLEQPPDGCGHDANTVPDRTTTATFASGRVAGPLRTAPVLASKLLPWQGQSMRPSATLLTVQP
jgi:hypothetical protein